MQNELQSSGAEWAYKNVYAKPLMKGSEYNYHPKILNSFCAINNTAEWVLLHALVGHSFNELIQFQKKSGNVFVKSMEYCVNSGP